MSEGTLKLGVENGAMCLVLDRDRAAEHGSWIPEQAGASCISGASEEESAVPLPSGVGPSPLADAYLVVWSHRPNEPCVRESTLRLGRVQCAADGTRVVLTTTPEDP